MEQLAGARKAIASSLVSVARDEDIPKQKISGIPIGAMFVGSFHDPDTGRSYSYAGRKGWHRNSNGNIVITDVTAFAWHEEIGYENDTIQYDRLYVPDYSYCYVFEETLDAYAAAGAASEGCSVDEFIDLCVSIAEQ